MATGNTKVWGMTMTIRGQLERLCHSKNMMLPCHIRSVTRYRAAQVAATPNPMTPQLESVLCSGHVCDGNGLRTQVHGETPNQRVASWWVCFPRMMLTGCRSVAWPSFQNAQGSCNTWPMLSLAEPNGRPRMCGKMCTDVERLCAHEPAVQAEGATGRSCNREAHTVLPYQLQEVNQLLQAFHKVAVIPAVPASEAGWK
jgi:hypothetical protein